MSTVGSVAQLWRYPVKSMRGDRVSSAPVTMEYGIPGDRGWAIRDEEIGEIRNGKQVRSLLQLHARYLSEPHGAEAPDIELTLPDGSTTRSTDPDVNDRLSAALERPVTLHPRRPADDLAHYRRASAGARTAEELRAMVDLDPDDPLPDFRASITEYTQATVSKLREFATPPGTYFDVMPLSLLTTSSLRTLREMAPDSQIDPRRFRKNIIVDSGDAEGFPEMDWQGRTIRIGSVVGLVSAPISRCVMVTLPQDDLPRDRQILRTLAQQASSNFGVYLNVLEPGEFAEGDPVTLD